MAKKPRTETIANNILSAMAITPFNCKEKQVRCKFNRCRSVLTIIPYIYTKNQYNIQSLKYKIIQYYTQLLCVLFE